MALILTFPSFKPSEIEAVTGVSPDTLKVWRRRKQLPDLVDHRWYDGRILAHLLARQALTKIGMTTEEAAQWAEKSVLPVFLWALIDGQSTLRTTVRGRSRTNLVVEVFGLGVAELPTFLIIEDDQTPQFASTLKSLPSPARMTGRYLNLRAIGQQLAATVRTPLLVIEDPAREGLTGGAPVRSR